MPVKLELGGKSPNIVFEDADFEVAVMGAISGIFAATGQTCIAGSRLLVQRSIHDSFVKRLVEVASDAKIGDPMSLDTHVGPVTTRPQYQKVMDYIEVAKQDGATCILGGQAYTGKGLWVTNLLSYDFHDVSNDMRIAQEEVFGPILSVIPFEDEEEAITLAMTSCWPCSRSLDIRYWQGVTYVRKTPCWHGLVNTYRAVSFMSLWWLQAVWPRARKRKRGNQGISPNQVRLDCPRDHSS